MMLPNSLHIKKLAICLYLVSMLTACITHKGKRSPSSFSSPVSAVIPVPVAPSADQSFLSLSQVRQLEAKHADLPIPMNAVPIPAQCVWDIEPTEQLKLAYRCPSAPAEIATFYDQRMEGWQEVDRFSGAELLINYHRPDRWCSVFIRPISNKNEPNLIIYMAPSSNTIVR